MDSSKIVNSHQSSPGSVADSHLAKVQQDSLMTVDRLRSDVEREIQFDLDAIKDRINQAFRQFLLAQEQERMPFLQRVITSHLENMENERGFPPRHPIHWVKSKLEFSSSGVLEFDTDRETELFIQAALQHIEAEIKDQLQTKQQAILQLIDRRIIELQQDLSQEIQSVAQARKIIATEYVNSFIRPHQLTLKAVDWFYFVSDGVRFDPHQEASYNQVCVRPGSRLGLGKQSQLRFAVSCDRLQNIVDRSLERSIGQLKQQSNEYLMGNLSDRIEELFAGLKSN